MDLMDHHAGPRRSLFNLALYLGDDRLSLSQTIDLVGNLLNVAACNEM